MSGTHIFKEKPRAFLENIYGTVLGQIRSENLVNDLLKFLKERKVNVVLDIGAGHAPVTFTLLHHYPDLKAILVEPSAKLIEAAKENQKHFGIDESRVVYVNLDLNGFLEEREKYSFDFVMCHVVVNWTPNPWLFMSDFIKLCDSKVPVSFVFGSSLAKAFRFSYQGNIGDLLLILQKPGSAVSSLIEKEKVIPLDPDMIARWIDENGCSIDFKAGVRIFADYVNPSLLMDGNLLMMLKQAEDIARFDERLWKFGQLVHFIFHKN